MINVFNLLFIILIMIITLKDFINSNIDNKTTLENNISSEVILGSENYCEEIEVCVELDGEYQSYYLYRQN
jgi:hypothetical protein